MSTKFIVTEFHGRQGEASGGSTKKTAPAKAAAKSKGSTGTPDGVDEALWATLVELAQNHNEHEGFVQAALEVEGVEGNRAAQKAIMGTKAGSVWASKE